MAAAEGDDGVCAGDSPEHAGPFEARADDGFAACFDHAGADEQVLASEFWIAHALGVALEVSGLDSDGVCNRGSAAIDASEKLYQLFDIAAVGFGLVTEDPLLLSRHVAGVE